MAKQRYGKTVLKKKMRKLTTILPFNSDKTAAYTFIGGIPTSGKTYLAEKLSKDLNCLHVRLDDLRKEMIKIPELEPWVCFLFNIKNEKDYWENITPEDHWNNMVKQSEAFWPTILNHIQEVVATNRSAIFECVNILPHLVKRDLDFSGIFLLGESLESTYNRNRKNPRWGDSEELQRIEAEWFFVHEGRFLKQEAEQHGFLCYSDTQKAEKELLRQMNC
jgi:2-phosphoglycerate kinase